MLNSELGEMDEVGREAVDWTEPWPEEMYRHSGPVTGVLVLAYLLVLLVGVVGNSLVVGVVLRSPRMRSVPNLFMANLAVADLLVILVCLPPTLLSNILVPWVLGGVMCRAVPYVQGLSVAASVYSLLAVSLDRFLAIWCPLGAGLSKGRARLVIAGIWALAGLLALPWLLVFRLLPAHPATPRLLFCVELWPAGLNGVTYFLVGNLGLCYVGPLAGISACYLLIWCRVLHRPVPSASAAALRTLHRKARMGVLRMLVVVVLVFGLCWLPLYALFARLKLGPPLSPQQEDLVAVAAPLAQWLGAANSCVNPLLYAFLNAKFRRAFVALLPAACRPARCSVALTKSSLLQPHPSSIVAKPRTRASDAVAASTS